jgi:SAM-dependent methyltransferase
MASDRSHEAIRDDWYRDTFGAFYPVIYAHRTVEAAAPEARFAIERSRLTPRDHVLDLCCGNGRHMVHLLSVTPHVVGLDYSPHLLDHARKMIGPQGELVRADMRAIPFVDTFDVVVNFFTSFGYFFSPEENAAVVTGIARALKPGGRFFLDYINKNWAEQTLEPESERRQGPYRIHERRWIDDERVNKVTQVYEGDALVQELSESVRLYSLGELLTLLGEGGLRVEAVYGDHTGVPMDAFKPRMIAVGRKD